MSAIVIAFAQRKGGAGKTTLAAHLAIALTQLGYAVGLIDTDPQGSLARWHQTREDRLGAGATGLGFVATSGWRSPAAVSLKGQECEILLVDTPASADGDVRVAVRGADLVVAPVQPSPVDVWATMPTLQLAQQERVPALLVLNRVPARASLTAAMRERLADYDVGLATVTIGNRIALAASFAQGYGIAEAVPGSHGADEIAALAHEILELLPPAALTRPKNAA